MQHNTWLSFKRTLITRHQPSLKPFKDSPYKNTTPCQPTPCCSTSFWKMPNTFTPAWKQIDNFSVNPDHTVLIVKYKDKDSTHQLHSWPAWSYPNLVQSHFRASNRPLYWRRPSRIRWIPIWKFRRYRPGLNIPVSCTVLSCMPIFTGTNSAL